MVGASPVFILNLTLGFNGLVKDNCNTRREKFMIWDWVRLILENWRYVLRYVFSYVVHTLTCLFHVSFGSINPSTYYLIVLLTRLFAWHICHASTRMHQIYVYVFQIFIYVNGIQECVKCLSLKLKKKVIALFINDVWPSKWRHVEVVATQITCNRLFVWQSSCWPPRNHERSTLLPLLERNPLVDGRFPSQRVSDTESFSLSWRH